jgi:hypothetical protein
VCSSITLISIVMFIFAGLSQAILLLCVANSYACILGRADEAPSDAQMIKFTANMFGKLGKKVGG